MNCTPNMIEIYSTNDEKLKEILFFIHSLDSPPNYIILSDKILIDGNNKNIIMFIKSKNIPYSCIDKKSNQITLNTHDDSNIPFKDEQHPRNQHKSNKKIKRINSTMNIIGFSCINNDRKM